MNGLSYSSEESFNEFLIKFPNIRYDINSVFKWDELNESLYVHGVLNNLAEIMGPKLKNWNIDIFSSNNPSITPSRTKYAENNILIYLSDELETVPLHLLNIYKHVFKAYLPYDNPEIGMHAFPLGCVNETKCYQPVSMYQREIDLFFSGNLNRNRIDLYKSFNKIFRYVPRLVIYYIVRMSKAIRWPFIKLNFNSVKYKFLIKFTTEFKGGMIPSEYSRALADSKIVLCPKGFHSVETFRHVEALRAGAIVISEKLPCTRLYKKSPIIEVVDWRTLNSIIEELLDSPCEIQSRSERSLAWWIEVLSEKGTARYISHILNTTQT